MRLHEWIRVGGIVQWREWGLSAGLVYRRGDGEVCTVVGVIRDMLSMFR